ncbi:MAG: Fe-S cluster assembly protein IscX [Magnetococcales bacterium]|jgi:FeS assembly protein IscX|nr:Fe-S cluster assembly protein IscX [Magnetococcales bacterium]
MKWTDTHEIAMALADTLPDQDPMSVRFTELMEWVMNLPGFVDTPQRCNEKVLEAIQMAWMDEV